MEDNLELPFFIRLFRSSNSAKWILEIFNLIELEANLIKHGFHSYQDLDHKTAVLSNQTFHKLVHSKLLGEQHFYLIKFLFIL